MWGESVGVCPEHPFKMGETLNGTPGLDIDAEVRLAERKVKELHADPDLSDKAITRALKDLGIQRLVSSIQDFVNFRQPYDTLSIYSMTKPKISWLQEYYNFVLDFSNFQ